MHGEGGATPAVEEDELALVCVDGGIYAVVEEVMAVLVECDGFTRAQVARAGGVFLGQDDPFRMMSL